MTIDKRMSMKEQLESLAADKVVSHQNLTAKIEPEIANRDLKPCRRPHSKISMKQVCPDCGKPGTKL